MSNSSLDDLPPDVEAVLRSERAETAAPESSRRRVWERVAATVGMVVPPLLPAALPGASALTRSGAPTPLAVKLGGAFALGAVVAGGLFVAWPHHPDPSHAPGITSPAAAVSPATAQVPPRRAVVAAPVIGAAPAAPAVAAAPAGGSSLVAAEAGPFVALIPAGVDPAASARPAHAPTAHRIHSGGRSHGAEPAMTAADTEAERRLVEQLRESLGRGESQEALALVRAHEHRYPHGLLIEERETLAVRALAAAGDSDAARLRATRFRLRFPGSVYLPAVEQALKSLR